MRKVTARRLVAEQLGQQHLSQPRVARAAAQMQGAGWVLGYPPRSDEPDREVVVVRATHPLAALLRQTFLASTTGAGAIAMPRGLAESRVGDLRQPEAGEQLARYGLLLMELKRHRVRLCGTSPLLAGIVNRLRYGGSRKGRDHAILLQAALGLAQRPRRLGAISDETLLQAAQVYEDLAVDASGLLERRARSHPRSHWLIPPMAATGATAAVEGGRS